MSSGGQWQGLGCSGMVYSPRVQNQRTTPFFLSLLVFRALALGVLVLACGEPEVEPKAAAEAASPPPAAPTPSRGSGFPLSDVTSASGIEFVHDTGAAGRRHYVETMGPGIVLLDADADGLLDIYVVNGGPLPGSPEPPEPVRNRLFRNLGGLRFEDITESAGVGDTGYGMGATAGDVDGDGDSDLYVLNYGPNVFFRNQGDGTFVEEIVGAEDPTWSVSGAFLDADGDGDLDLYVANYLRYDVEVEGPCRAGNLEIYCSPEEFPPTPDRLYRNDGDRFTDVSEVFGVVADGRGMGVAAADLDDDGRTDVYVTNDRSQNLLYRNQEGGFEEVGAETGVGYSELGQTEGGMGVALADLAGTGQPAIFLTNFQKEPNRLYVPAVAGFFDDHTSRSGLGFPSTELVGWGIGSFDLEGDGDVDLAVANGHVFDNAAAFIPGSAFELPDHLYRNDGGGRFELTEFPRPHHSTRGLVTGDLDGDGDPDLVTAACGGPLQVWRNDAGAPERFLVVRLEGKGANRDAIGARVRAEVGDRTLWRDVVGGGSYASTSDYRLYFGLGSETAVRRLEARWPDGSTETLDSEAGGQLIIWRQGEGVISRTALEGGSP